MPKLKDYFTQIESNAKAVPYIPTLLCMISYGLPEKGTWEDCWWLLFSGGLCFVVVSLLATLYLAWIWKDRWIEYPVRPLAEGVGLRQYAISIFSSAIILAFLTAIGGGLGFQTVGKPMHWPAFIGIILLKNIILAGPITIWGWKLLSKLPRPTSIEDLHLPDPFHSP